MQLNQFDNGYARIKDVTEDDNINYKELEVLKDNKDEYLNPELDQFNIIEYNKIYNNEIVENDEDDVIHNSGEELASLNIKRSIIIVLLLIIIMPLFYI